MSSPDPPGAPIWGARCDAGLETERQKEIRGVGLSRWLGGDRDASVRSSRSGFAVRSRAERRRLLPLKITPRRIICFEI